jgi:hypothetical protein
LTASPTLLAQRWMVPSGPRADSPRLPV